MRPKRREIDLHSPRALARRTLLLSLVAALIAGAAYAVPDDPCVVPDDGTGTVELPPAGCGYLSPQDVHMIIDGLPPGTTIELAPIHRGFFGPGGVPGGNLGGEKETFNSVVVFSLTGTGELAGFQRLLTLPASVETHTAPRTPGDPVQSFDTDMFALAGSLPPGDPDFQQLQVVAGTSVGLPSPGHTTLTRLGPPGSDFQVDSFFDIAYQIDFVGAPGGQLDGLSGSTQDTVRVEAAGERDPCIADDDGTGTVVLPPAGCDYLSPQEVHQIIDGLPPGTTIELDPRHTAFICDDPTGCVSAGGGLGGQIETFDSTLVLQLAGTDTLSDFRRTLRVPVAAETHTGPRTPGDPVQSFPTDMFTLQGSLFGDPDFAQLTITGGTGNGLPSPGHTTLTDLGDGTFNVDSFFDIEYQIDFVGAPGGALDGLSGSTTSRVRVTARRGKVDSVEPDNGLGTVNLPPEGATYMTPDEVHLMIDGLPPGTTIELDPSHWLFFCDNIPCGQPGGGLGGERELFDSTLDFELRGTGDLTGFQRQISIPAAVETHTGPRTAGGGGPTGAAIQSFDTEMVALQGSLSPGDPDFQQLTVTAGSANGLPSPGHTTLTDQSDGTFLVDSFFDVEYRIDFVGATGGVLDGLSGSTTGQTRVTACEKVDPSAPAHNVTVVKDADHSGSTDFLFSGDLGSFSLDDDADPGLPNQRTFSNLAPGTFTVTETLPAGWVLDDIVCDDPDGGTTVNLVARQAGIELDLGESITCTYFDIFAPCGVVVLTNDELTGSQVVQACGELEVGPNLMVGSSADVDLFGGGLVRLLNDVESKAGATLDIGVCGHDLCSTGDPLDDGCMPCVTEICAVEPACCTSAWNASCVANVGAVCKLGCP